MMGNSRLVEDELGLRVEEGAVIERYLKCPAALL